MNFIKKIFNREKALDFATFIKANGLQMDSDQQMYLFLNITRYNLFLYEDAIQLISEDKTYQQNLKKAFLHYPKNSRPKTASEMLFNVFSPYFTFNYTQFKAFYIKHKMYSAYFDFERQNPGDGIYIREFGPLNYTLDYQERGHSREAYKTQSFDEFIDIMIQEEGLFRIIEKLSAK